MVTDALSWKHQICSGEWSIHPAKEIVGTPMIDPIAAMWSHNFHLFCSPVADNEALWVEALVQDWPKMNTYAFPPSFLITKVVKSFSIRRNVDDHYATSTESKLISRATSPIIILPQEASTIEVASEATDEGDISQNSVYPRTSHTWRLCDYETKDFMQDC